MTIPAKPKAPTHSCPGRCGLQVAHHQFACPDCWHRLPFTLRKPITTHYRRNPGAHQAAMADGIEWYANNPLDVTSKGGPTDG